MVVKPNTPAPASDALIETSGVADVVSGGVDSVKIGTYKGMEVCV